MTFHKIYILFFVPLAWLAVWNAFADSEVLDKPTTVNIRIREHPFTNRPFVVITDPSQPASQHLRSLLSKPYGRPDYRMLDHRYQKGEIPYEGPYSDRKKVYIFGATLATAGMTGGAFAMAAAPAAAGGAATGGAGYLVGGTALLAGSTAAAVHATTGPRKEIEEFTRTSEAELLTVTHHIGG